MFKKIIWILRRHPRFFYWRFKLLSKNSSVERVTNFTYNSQNPIETIPDIYFNKSLSLFSGCEINSDYDKALQIARWLRQNTKGGPGLGKSSEETLRLMLEGKGGICSDFSQVYNNFCVINNIKVKEWGLNQLPYDKGFGGHSYNEFYSSVHQKWVFIDVSRVFLYYEIESNIPLSVLEFFEFHRKGIKIEAKSILPDKYFEEENMNYLYYRKGIIPFVLTNYSNKKTDYYLNKFDGVLPISIIHILIILTGNSYRFEFPLDDFKKMKYN